MFNNNALEIMIPPNSKRGRRDDEDRLSDLPDCVFLHILSFFCVKFAVQTRVLSPRWKFVWKTIPTLILHSSKLSTKKRFATFVTKIVTLRDSSTALHAVDLDRPGNIEPHLLKKILNYVRSHNTHIQQFRISVNGEICPILSCVSSCWALTSLKLYVYPKDRDGRKTLFPKSLNLPALTNLELANFTFCASDNAECTDPYTTFNSLNSLTICYFTRRDAPILSISNATLVNLTICSSDFNKIKLSTPSLYTFTFCGPVNQKLRGSNLSPVKQVDIDVKSLTVTQTTLKDKA